MPLLVNEAGALVLVGRVMVVVIGPVVGPVPPLVTVMGTLLGLLATKTGAGWPMTVVRSGVAAALMTVLTLFDADDVVSPPPMTLAVLTAVPDEIGLTVTLIVEVPLTARAVLLVQFRFWPLAVQVKPPLPLTKVTWGGRKSVMVTTPFDGPVPVFVTINV